MTNFYATTFAAFSCGALLLACNSVSEPLGERRSFVQQPIVSDVPGYRHDVGHSRFRTGSIQSVVTNGTLQRAIGTEGVFATNLANGATSGVSNSDAPGLRLFPYSGSADAHNNAVRSYFVNSGLPADQIADVHVNTEMRGQGDPMSQPPTFHAFYSVVDRAISGVYVVGSVAWACMNNAGDVVAEGVYWPAIPRTVADEAIALQNRLSDPSRRAQFIASIPSQFAGDGRLVIRHSGQTEDSAFIARVSFDVPERAGGGSSYFRHFDSTGTEFRMPAEVVSGTPRTR